MRRRLKPKAPVTNQKRRPRILLAVTSDVSLRLLRGFPEYLVQRGWDVHVVCSPGPVFDARELSSSAHLHALEMKRNPSPWSDMLSFVAWLRLCARIRPDLISAGTPKAGLLGGIAGLVMRVPHRVYHQRGLRLETSTGLQRVLLGVTERIAVGSAHVVLAVSPSLAKAMVDLRIVAPKKITVVGSGSSNGVDTSEFHPDLFAVDALLELRRSLRLRDRVPTIGYVGRLTRDKGFDVLEEAALKMRESGVEFDLMVVGGVDDSTSQETLARLLDSGVSIVAVGSVPDPAIYFQLMDVLCLPTYREGFPNVVLEAAASGTATVTTDATGAVDSVVDGVTGWIVPMGDSESLALRLIQVLADPVDLRAAGSRAQQRAISEFDRPVVWDQLFDFYSDQMGLERKTSPLLVSTESEK